MFGKIIENSLTFSTTKKEGYKFVIHKPKPKSVYPYKQKIVETEENIIIDWELDNSYWDINKYNELVENEIAKKYTIKQELAIQRQKESKPEEYNEYFTYCEECKRKVKEKLGI